jgi:hypothetical protein
LERAPCPPKLLERPFLLQDAVSVGFVDMMHSSIYSATCPRTGHSTAVVLGPEDEDMCFACSRDTLHIVLPVGTTKASVASAFKIRRSATLCPRIIFCSVHRVLEECSKEKGTRCQHSHCEMKSDVNDVPRGTISYSTCTVQCRSL